VTNARGKPLAGVSLDWVTTDSGRLDPEKTASNDSGLVRASWTLGTRAGRHTATATLGTRVVTFSATAVEPLSLGAVRNLRLATFDGSGQVVHPDVARVPRGWAPARRFLAITPYPGGDVARELPSIYESGDPAAWEVPEGVTNPIVKPWKGYLSDPDLLFEPRRRELWMYFRHVSQRNSVFLTVSGDGTHWSRPTRIVSAPNHELVSPTVVRVSEGNWHMWAVNAGGLGCKADSTTVEHRTSTDGLHWSAPQTVDVSGADALPPWHIDVIWVPEVQEFWALYNEKPSRTCVTPALRLSTGILIAPLRPAALLAKQVATLDVLSSGRVDLGVGVGWQKEEYDAQGLDFAQRGALLDDTIAACRALWSDLPASFESRSVHFSETFCSPQPAQPRLPVWFGGSLTQRMLARIADLGDGWIPIMGATLDDVREGAARLAALGSRPIDVQMRATTVMGDDGKPDPVGTMAGVPELTAVGVTDVTVNLATFAPTLTEAPAALTALGEAFREVTA
jgi:probable F420-dependent oxidoreductase